MNSTTSATQRRRSPTAGSTFALAAHCTRLGNPVSGTSRLRRDQNVQRDNERRGADRTCTGNERLRHDQNLQRENERRRRGQNLHGKRAPPPRSEPAARE